ncbi:MAG TPA: RluA family pseudouridine synthase [Pirellulales bacterium]|jgi:23S rRNA pseudouridine1911/1915/1917 synthase|nr:RluA family pseudouridine synthase [Pirellulales bacterium]
MKGDATTPDAANLAAPIEVTVAESGAGMRLDWFLAREFPAYSRTNLRRAINAATVRLNGRRIKASHRLRAGEQLSVELPALPRKGPVAEEIPLDILYEDDALAAINKPPAMVVHPGRGHWRGTLAAALQFHFNRLSSVGGATRPGIVHRLDRDTSGIIIVAKDDQTHQALTQQFERRTVEKEYFAVVAGVPTLDRELVDLPIGVHPQQREKMAVRRHHAASRHAQTFFEVVERFDGFAAVRARPKTGRTHQIRVHLATLGCPVLCDRLYGSRARITRGELRRRPEEDDTLLIDRQALHAWRLSIDHPRTGERMTFEAPLPNDIERVIEALREFRTVATTKARKS